MTEPVREIVPARKRRRFRPQKRLRLRQIRQGHACTVRVVGHPRHYYRQGPRPRHLTQKGELHKCRASASPVSVPAVLIVSTASRASPPASNSHRRHARAALAGRIGKPLGRPRAVVELWKLETLRADGASVREIGKDLGVGVGVVQRILSLGRLAETRFPR